MLGSLNDQMFRLKATYASDERLNVIEDKKNWEHVEYE